MQLRQLNKQTMGGIFKPCRTGYVNNSRPLFNISRWPVDWTGVRPITPFYRNRMP